MNLRHIRPSRLLAALPFLAAFLSTLLGAGVARARSAGIDSSQFSNVSLGCNNCHTTATAVAPTVALSASTLALTSGQQIVLTFVVTSNNAPTQHAAGFNIRSSQRGTFAVGGAASAGTRTIANGSTAWLEATHSTPKENDGANQATFTTLWTPNDGVSGTVTFTAWGNSVNISGNNQGDRAATTTLNVTVTPTCTLGTWYHDVDGDGYGNPSDSTIACPQPAGYVSNNADCNDGAAAIHPGAAEVCNGVDDDCVGGVDNGDPTATYYRDVDGDGYGNAASGTKVACSLAQAGGGYVENNTDCNDASASIHPGAAEVCDGADQDCDNVPDNGLPTPTYYRDADGDGWGAPNVTKAACSLAVAGAGYVSNNSDCDDTSSSIFPGAPEICANQKDDNCNGVVDTDAPVNSTFYRDIDGDGFGSAASGTTTACAPPTGYVSNNTDCSDNDAAVHPGATEVCNNKDDNCDTNKDEGLAPLSCGDGACRTTVAACSGGVPQTCTPVCPEAGVDAAKDVQSVDTGARDTGADAVKDGATPADVATHVEAGADVSSSDVVAPPPVPDAGSSGDMGSAGQPDAVGAPDARVDAKVDAPATGADGGAIDDNGEPSEGCSCRTASRPRGGLMHVAGGALLLLAIVRRRRERRR